uniref:Uncharacterized protein n=1 Tax=Aegilops tauschii subsp. strangulata TaxID=200361 RepID=A0A452YLN8_AEGTS
MRIEQPVPGLDAIARRFVWIITNGRKLCLYCGRLEPSWQLCRVQIIIYIVHEAFKNKGRGFFKPRLFTLLLVHVTPIS